MNYKQGNYSQKQLNKKKYIRKNKHNKIYAGKHTQRELEKRVKIARTVIIVIVLIGISQWLSIPRIITVQSNGSAVETSECVPPQLAESASCSSLSVDEVDYQPTVENIKQEIINQARWCDVLKEIKGVSEEHKFEWTDYLLRLAFYESSFDPKAINVNKSGSIDRGVFQWNDKYHPEISDECAFSVRCATVEAIKAINNGNQHWWVANEKAKNNVDNIKFECYRKNKTSSFKVF